MKLISIHRSHNKHPQEPSSLLPPTTSKSHHPFLHLFRKLLRPFSCTTTTTTTNPSSSITPTKKRLSTSLNPTIQDQETQEPQEAINNNPSQQSHSTTVIGTIFGHRRGHVCFCIQQDRLSSNTLLLLQLTMQTHLLAKEMQTGYLRIALKSNNNNKQNEPSSSSSSSLLSVPVWTMYCNGRKAGFAFKRKVSVKDRLLLKTVQSSSAGAGVIPAAVSTTSEEEEEEGDVMYMRGIYERVVGSCDSETYHLLNPHGSPGQELTVFFIRSG